eukprot:GEMP01029398.1.p1 GENE.GEMP01029398.1~~GEMP01029398.1.p1  ORF type:complete len:389 (+),score=55.22 GEMP01029398.1:113-1279(+)
MMWRWLLAIAALHAALYGAVYVAVPSPFMDEIFHIPQATRYCDKDFTTWDPSITTPPMLYVFSLLFTPFMTCSTNTLRATVSICGPLSALLLYDIIRRAHPTMPSHLRGLRLMRAVLSPLHFFYHALYYTEPVSTLFVLLMMWCHMRKNYRLAGIFGACSVCVRQFNVVWVFGSAMDVLLALPLTRWVSVRTISLLICHIATGVGFFAFAILNGSVALGHQQYHGTSLHLCMILYCFAFMLAFMGEWRPKLSKWMIVSLPLLSLMGMSVVVHPFLLADNRHIAFILWRRVLHFDWVRQGVIPVFLSLFLPRWNRQTALFLTCTALVVCLTPLFEPRYFLLPCLAAVTFQRPTTRRTELFGLAQCVVVNAVVFGLFFGKGGPDGQRIIW